MTISVSVRGETPESMGSDWNFLTGGGISYAPSFYGSKYYQIMAIPVIMVDFRRTVFLSMEGLGCNLINWHWLRIGAAIKYDFGRNEKGDELLKYFSIYYDKQPDLKGLGDVDDAVSPGGFGELRFKSISLNMKMYKAVNGYKSFTGKAGIKYNGLIPLPGFPLICSVDLHTAFAGSGYNNAYYGVDEIQSERSGLEIYNAGSGFISYGTGLFLIHPFTQSLSVSAFGMYDRLTRDIRNSPVIREYGNRNQYNGGVMINYGFSF